MSGVERMRLDTRIVLLCKRECSVRLEKVGGEVDDRTTQQCIEKCLDVGE